MNKLIRINIRCSGWFKTPTDSSTCLDVLFRVGELVSRLPDSRSGSEYPCSTSLALAFVPPLPSSAENKTCFQNAAFWCFLRLKFKLPNSILKNWLQLGLLCSHEVMKVRRSSTVMRDSFKSATLSFFFFKGRVAAIQTSEGEFSMEPEVDLLIFFLRFMCGILSSWAASLVSGNNVSLRSQNARYLKSKKQPLAATCSHSSGRKWLQLAARASGRKWPQVAASGR